MSNKFSFKNTVIFGGNFTATNEVRGDNGRQMLSQSPYVVHGAIHDSGQRYPPSECHPGTREDILRMAETWVDKSLSESESMLFWLSGPAGVGKTAIAQSLCKILQGLGRLGGDFFFSRSVAGHGNFHTLFPTLAYQLGIIYPEFGFELDAVMKEDVSVLTKNLEVQLRQLLVNPLNRAENKPDTPFVLVIDGLDEAGGEDDQISFLHLLAWHFLPHRLPLKIIVTSRPEPWIKSSFATNPLRLHTHNHFLRRTSQTDDDIRTLLISKFAEIQGTHDLMKNRAESWPPCEIIDEIVDKASGQFIYASTVLRFIADPNGNPAQRLLWIVNAWSRSSSGNVKPDYSPYSALDNLYQHILSTSSNIENTLALLWASIAHGIDRNRYLPIWLKSPPSPSIALLEKLLMLREGDGFLAVRTIQSLVEILPDGSIQFYHKSFQDFILDSNRSGEYCVKIDHVCSKLILGAFRVLKSLKSAETISVLSGGDRDLLLVIRVTWMVWWLFSAVHDQDQLLSEIKSVNKSAFYRKYIASVAQKAPSLLFRTCHSGKLDIDDIYQRCCRAGNIAEAIMKELDGRAPFTLPLENIVIVDAILRECFFVHLRPN